MPKTPEQNAAKKLDFDDQLLKFKAQTLNFGYLLMFFRKKFALAVTNCQFQR